MTACVIHPTRRAPEALPDSLACATCVDELGADLAVIDQLLPRLRALLEPGHSGDLGRRIVASSPAPLRVDVLSLLDTRSTDGPDAVLHRWARAAGTPATGAGLRGRLSWFIEQDQILRAFAREIRALAAEMRRACGAAHLADETPPAARRVAVCRRDIRGRECGGAILAAPGADVAICQRCKDGWTRDRWPFLARLQEPVDRPPAAEAG